MTDESVSKTDCVVCYVAESDWLTNGNVESKKVSIPQSLIIWNEQVFVFRVCGVFRCLWYGVHCFAEM